MQQPLWYQNGVRCPLALCLHLCKAFAAINGTVSLRFKGNFGFAATGCAGCGEVFTGATGGVLARVTACLAALGLVLEAAFRIEFLFTGSENEFVTAFFAN